MFLGKANVASRLWMGEGEAMSLEGVRRGLSGSHLPRPRIRGRQVHRQAEPLQWPQKEQTPGAGPWGARVLVDVGFGLRNHAGWEFSLGPEPHRRVLGEEQQKKRAFQIVLPTPPQPCPGRSGCGDQTCPLGKVPGPELGRPARGEGQECGRGAGRRAPQGRRASHPPPAPGAAGAQRMTQKRVLW